MWMNDGRMSSGLEGVRMAEGWLFARGLKVAPEAADEMWDDHLYLAKP
jgi:hypothetical protein